MYPKVAAPLVCLASCLLLAVGDGAAFGATPVPPLSLSFGSGTITIRGTARNQPVYLFGIAREPHGYITQVQPHEARLVDANGIGSVTYPFDETLSHRSNWLAVDLTSGTATTSAPPGYRVDRFDLDDKHLKKDAGGEIAQLSADGTFVELVVVRPGGGVWGQTVGSRGPADEGSENGKVTIAIANLQPRGGTAGPPPKKLKKGDVVFILDSFHAHYGIATVGD